MLTSNLRLATTQCREALPKRLQMIRIEPSAASERAERSLCYRVDFILMKELTSDIIFITGRHRWSLNDRSPIFHLHGEAPLARAANLEWRMGSLVLDPVARILIHDGTPLPLGERAVSILLMLVERSGQLVSKEDLIAFAWQGLAVEDSNLTVQVAALRRALALVPGGSPGSRLCRGAAIVSSVPPYDPGTTIRRHRMNHGQPDRLMKWQSYPVQTRGRSKDLPTLSALTDSRAHHMVGRAAPLDMLDRMAQRMLSGQRQIAFVTGEAGIGKTAFIQMAVDRLSQQGVDLSCGRCTERFGTDEAFLPLIDALVTRCRSTRRRTADSNSHPRANLDAADTRLIDATEPPRFSAKYSAPPASACSANFAILWKH